MNIGDIVKLHLERTETMINGSMVPDAEVLGIGDDGFLDLGIPIEGGHIQCLKTPAHTPELEELGERYWTSVI